MSSAQRTIENSPAIHRWVVKPQQSKARETGDRVSLTASSVVRFADSLSSSVCQPSSSSVCQPSTEVLGYYRSSASPTFCAESHKDHRQNLLQKLSRKPNCNLRIADADVITPKVVDVVPEGTELPGCPRFTWLKTFVPSARKRRRKRSLKRKSRESARSATQ